MRHAKGLCALAFALIALSGCGTLTVNDQQLTVIGAAEPGFAVPKGGQLWLPRIER